MKIWHMGGVWGFWLFELVYIDFVQLTELSSKWHLRGIVDVYVQLFSFLLPNCSCVISFTIAPPGLTKLPFYARCWAAPLLSSSLSFLNPPQLPQLGLVPSIPDSAIG